MSAAGGAAASHTPPDHRRSHLPGARLQAVTRNSLTLHPRPDSQGVGGVGGAWTLFNAVCKAAFRCALRGRPGIRRALPPPAAPRPPPPAPGSLLPTPAATTLSRPSRTTETTCYPPAAHVGRGLMLQPPEIIHHYDSYLPGASAPKARAQDPEANPKLFSRSLEAEAETNPQQARWKSA